MIKLNDRRARAQTAFLGALLLTLCSAAASFGSDSGVSAKDAFGQLKNLVGPWQGVAQGSGNEGAESENGHSVVHEFRASAGGTVVMETMSPGTDHEMINMYHLDGADLLLTHYCSGGNQPQMKLDRESSSATKLVFDFVGGTNLNAATDHHIHDASIRWNEDGTLSSAWTGYSNGEPAGKMVFTLERKK